MCFFPQKLQSNLFLIFFFFFWQSSTLTELTILKVGLRKYNLRETDTQEPMTSRGSEEQF